jgi:hypothetical protein
MATRGPSWLSGAETTMRRRWPIIAALGLGLPLLAVFATGCHHEEVAYYGPYRHGVYVERGYDYYPYGLYAYPYGYDGGYGYHGRFRHEREAREHAFRGEREHAFRYEGHREHHG